MKSNFQKRVLEIVKKISKGKVSNYKEIARLAGSPRGWRAVGNILNKNKNPEIPCHRIIKSDGEVGGYSRGQKRKLCLLEKEGVLIKNGRVIGVN